MPRSVIRSGWIALLLGLVITVPVPLCAAGTKIQVTFSGTGFSGCFQYDQSQPKKSPHVFNFNSSTLSHELCYKIGTSASVCTSGAQCEPYEISTSGNNNTTFQLQATAPAGTTVTIVLPSTVTFSATSLPFCTVNNTSVFQNQGTFTVTGGTTFTGTITATNCTSSTGVIHCACPATAPAPGSGCDTYTVSAPAPQPCPVFVCNIRPACRLTRLFSRCSARSRCL